MARLHTADCLVNATDEVMCDAEVVGAWLSRCGGLECERTALVMRAMNAADVGNALACAEAMRRLAASFKADHVLRIERVANGMRRT